jgi:hypothetical protein
VEAQAREGTGWQDGVLTARLAVMSGYLGRAETVTAAGRAWITGKGKLHEDDSRCLG